MSHDVYMRRAISLAQHGGKATATNPNVGAVIVHNDRIIGEGYHRTYGQAHAEVEAVTSVREKDRGLLSQSTMYVTLEPCNHYGKTPPCSSLIIDRNIPKVVIGCLDPSDKMSGKSVALLREHGCEVTVGIMEQACKDLIRPFVAHQSERPYIILKQAVSQDGFIGKTGRQVWLTGSMSRVVAHHWRDRVDAILIGTNTAVVDNPSLTTRAVAGDDPLRIILDRTGRIPSDHQVLSDGGKSVVLTQVVDYPSKVHTVVLQTWSIASIVQALWQLDIRYLLVEGGASIIKAFYEAQLWDEALHFKSPKLLVEGIKAINIEGRLVDSYALGPDTLTRIVANQNYFIL